MKVYTFIMVAGALLLTGCNQSIESASTDFNTLPRPVQKTVRAQSPNGEIVSVGRTTSNGAEVYKVEFRAPTGGKNPTVVVAPDGTLISTDMAEPAGALKKMLTPTGAVGTPFSSLPEKVQRTIQEHAPQTAIAGITRHERNGRTIYEVEFQDAGKNPTIEVAEDGALVQTLQK
jgi:uncharacterized membrane protein YkoI